MWLEWNKERGRMREDEVGEGGRGKMVVCIFYIFSKFPFISIADKVMYTKMLQGEP